jgi:lipopolysaccharide transport system ATP-binding protein
MSSRPPAISVTGLAKAYRITRSKGRSTLLSEALKEGAKARFRRAPKDTFYALRDIDLVVQPGEAVGVIGRNGAGKSTLLKVLSRVTEPTAGRIELRGRLGSLLEVGTGFHPELTGRENVFLNGAILGMRRAEIARAFDSIVAFAQVDKFLETPVKRYSSGMYVRLAFAVAAHLRSEILVVDEVLAVGDAQFQKKCIGKMGEVSSEEGRTVLFVSHQMVSVQAFCRRTVVLEDGRLVFDGQTEDAIERYLSGANDAVEQSRGVFDLEHVARASQVKQPMLRRLEVRDGDGRLADTITQGGDLCLTVDVDGLQVPQQYLVFVISNETDVKVLYFNTLMKPPEVFDPEARQDRIVLRFPKLPLTPGKYFVEVVLTEGGMAVKSTLDRVERAASFEVTPADVFGSGYQMRGGPRGGVCFVVPEWEVQGDGVIMAATSTETAEPGVSGRSR